MKAKQKTGLFLLLVCVVALVVKFVLMTKNDAAQPYMNAGIIIIFLISLVLIFNFSGILFDPNEDGANKSLTGIVLKIRYRGILYNNIAIILFLLTFIIIFVCFYWFLRDETKAASDQNAWVNIITAKVAASALLIFLVQILFRVFKYLLRVAAFYHARADAIEFLLHNHVSDNDTGGAAIDIEKQQINLEKLMTLFTPGSYDISELDKASLLDGIADLIKAKLGK